MKTLSPGFSFRKFLDRVRESSERQLFLDYDGTLAPFTEDPASARPYPGVLPLLQSIQDDGRTHLCIITGRAIDSLLPLLPLRPLPEVWGAHGFEHRTRAGVYRQLPVPVSVATGLQQLSHTLAHLRREEKPGSLAIHWRGEDPAAIDGIRQDLDRAWNALPDRTGLLMRDFDGGVEFKARSYDKGSAVRAARVPGAVCAFLGDDRTDEDGFAALEEGDAAVLVRGQWRPTRASLWLRSPAELLAFLDEWRLAARAARPASRPYRRATGDHGPAD